MAPSGETLALSKSERILLVCLVSAAGEVVSREALLQSLSNDEPDFDPHRLEMLVHRLRRKVQVATGDALPLVTVRGQGYVLLQ